MLGELVGDHPIRPFGVVDDGWSPDGLGDGRRASGGPWNSGRLPTFPDMAGVAAAIGAEGVRPGIWFRPLLSRTEPAAGLARANDDGWVLDPTHPATRDQVTDDVTCLRGWGFELIKHDFSTYDLLGRWGPQMGAVLDDGRWLPHDRSLTTAEALVSLYQCIRDAAGDTVVLGCNVVGHLAAGLVEAQRIGDDTSGLAWGRTRRVGVNTLAFRLAQHGALFSVDADCVPSTPHTPWSLNRRFLDLVSRSGTALFVSVDPSTRSDAVDADLAAGLRLALDGGVRAGVEPIDWLHTTSPSRWRSGEAEQTYDWLEPWGADPFESWPLQGPAVDS
jgi:alpha-galactosidase